MCGSGWATGHPAARQRAEGRGQELVWSPGSLVSGVAWDSVFQSLVAADPGGGGWDWGSGGLASPCQATEPPVRMKEGPAAAGPRFPVSNCRNLGRVLPAPKCEHLVTEVKFLLGGRERNQ